MSLLGCAGVPEDLRAKLGDVIAFYQRSLESCGRSAAEACEGAMGQLKSELSAAVQRRIELEMELTKCKTQGAAAPERGAGDVQRTAPQSVQRREYLLLRAKLLESRRAVRGFARNEKRLNAQIEFLMGSVDKDKRELLGAMAEQISELDRHRDESQEDGSVLRDKYRALKTECERLKRSEDEYQADIFRKAGEIFQLSRENSELSGRALILDQYRVNYAGLHRSFVENIIATKSLDSANRELRESLARREEFYGRYLLDMQIREDFSERLREMGEQQRELHRRCLRECESGRARVAEELRGLKTALGGAFQPAGVSADVQVAEEVDTEGVDDQVALSRAPSPDSILRTMERVKWEVESIRADVAGISSLNGRIRECFDALASSRAVSDERPPDGLAELESQMVKKENTILAEDNAYLRRNLEELNAQHQSARGELERLGAERAELLAEIERRGQIAESARSGEQAPEAAFDESYYRKYIGDLERQMESYKDDVRCIEEKFDRYKQLYESFDIQGSRDLIKELKMTVSRRDAYIEKQGLLLERYRKLKEAFIQLKQR